MCSCFALTPTRASGVAVSEVTVLMALTVLALLGLSVSLILTLLGAVSVRSWSHMGSPRSPPFTGSSTTAHGFTLGFVRSFSSIIS